MIRRPRPDQRPEPCFACYCPRVWWPTATGFAPACPWCERDTMCAPPDDIDHDADTVLEPVTATAQPERAEFRPHAAVSGDTGTRVV